MNRISMKHICLAICFVISTAICQITSPYAHQKKFDYEYEEYKNHKRWIPPSSPKFESDSILTLIGRWAWGPCLTVDVKDNYAFIGNGPTFHVLDISNPLCPTIIGEYITDG